MFLNEATKLRAQTIIKGLEKRNMEGVFCETKEDALAKALSYIEEGSSVTWGGSMSISEIGLMDAVKNGNYEIIDRSVAKNYDEQREIFSKAVLADYYLMSSNAITLDGELINIDGDTCICSQIVVTRRQSAAMRGRIKIILVGESLGY